MMMRRLVLVAQGETIECADRGDDSALVQVAEGVVLRYFDSADRSTGQWDLYPWHTIRSWGRHRYYPKRTRSVAVGPARRSNR